MEGCDKTYEMKRPSFKTGDSTNEKYINSHNENGPFLTDVSTILMFSYSSYFYNDADDYYFFT